MGARSDLHKPATQAVVLSKAEPEYSENARRTKLQGDVLLQRYGGIGERPQRHGFREDCGLSRTRRTRGCCEGKGRRVIIEPHAQWGKSA